MRKLLGSLIVGSLLVPILLSACGKKEEPADAGSTTPGPKADSDRNAAGRERSAEGGGK